MKSPTYVQGGINDGDDDDDDDDDDDGDDDDETNANEGDTLQLRVQLKREICGWI